MLDKPFYDPTKTYEENFKEGPFGAFADLSSEASAKEGGKVFENQGEPKFEILGQKVFTPFGIPAGPLINGNFVKAALDKGFDIATYKTVRSSRHPCHPWPNVASVKAAGDLTLEQAEKGVMASSEFAEPLSITNSFGVPSFEPDFWQKDLAEAVNYAKVGQVVVGSFQGTPKGNEKKYVQDFADTAKLVKETGVKLLEVNLSCPNEGSAHLLCFDLERTGQVVEAIKNQIGNLPLIIKIAYFKDDSALEKLVTSIGKMVQGIEAINTIGAKILDTNGNQYLPGEGRLKSGVCGSAIKWAGLEMAKRLKALREKLNLSFSVIGVGGIMNVEDYEDYKQAGADAGLSATGAMWQPLLAQEIKQAFL